MVRNGGILHTKPQTRRYSVGIGNTRQPRSSVFANNRIISTEGLSHPPDDAFDYFAIPALNSQLPDHGSFPCPPGATYASHIWLNVSVIRGRRVCFRRRNHSRSASICPIPSQRARRLEHAEFGLKQWDNELVYLNSYAETYQTHEGSKDAWHGPVP